MGGVARAVGSFFGFGSKPRIPKYTGPSAEEAAQAARDRAAKEAAEVRAANEKAMAEMNKKLEMVRNQKTDYSQGTLGGQKSGLSGQRNRVKEKRAMSARKTQVKLDPGGGDTNAGQVVV
tara:strand:- start:112 stop:471 length:360 start_codon:yes stop_codon:yes gene_type:complete